MKKCNEIIRDLREDNDLTQANIAKIIGTSQQHYSKYEAGEYDISLNALAELSKYYDVSADFIMGMTECREGNDALNTVFVKDCTVGKLISAIVSLSDRGRESVVEYVDLQRLKEKVGNRK